MCDHGLIAELKDGHVSSVSASFDFEGFMATSHQGYWVILNDAEFKLFQQHHVLQVPHVKESSHQLNWKLHQRLADSIYHVIYLTVAHCIRHGSPASSTNLQHGLRDRLRDHDRWSSSALGVRKSGRHQVTQSLSTSSRSSQAFKLHGSDLDLQIIQPTSWFVWRSKRVRVKSCSLL